MKINKHFFLGEAREVNRLMSDIIGSLKRAMQPLNRKNKQKIWYLLQAFRSYSQEKW